MPAPTRRAGRIALHPDHGDLLRDWAGDGGAVRGARAGRCSPACATPSAGADLRARAADRGLAADDAAASTSRSDESVAAAASHVLRETGGRLDVLINNAGYYQFGALEETSPDELRAQLETNVVGVLRVTRAVLPAMRTCGSGTIITLGSVSGRVAVPMGAAYTASKWALEGMIESLRLELIPFGVRVVLMEPGPVPHRAARQRAAGGGRGRSGQPIRRPAGGLSPPVSEAAARRRIWSR